MPNVKNYIRKSQSLVPYRDSETASIMRERLAKLLEGQSDFSLNRDTSGLEEEDYNRIVQSKDQVGYFTSLLEKKRYTILHNNSEEKAVVKEKESILGDPYSYLSDLVSSSKKTNVKEDSSLSSQVEDYSNPTGIFSGKDSTSKESLKNTDSKSTPYIVIRESRTGVASYPDLSLGKFSDSDIVEIRCFQRVDTLNVRTQQNFETVMPRGSQTPMRFYNNQSERSISIACKFHQQEFPLEPLFSIAEKAQYLARPYRNGDFSLIPKLVEIYTPGRVFRGYVTEASCNFRGDDYHNWSILDIQSLVDPSKDNQYLGGRGFYGGYQSRELEPNGGTVNGKENLTNETVYYDYSELEITFQLAIVEEIKLTVYQTQAEIEAQQLEDEIRAYQRSKELAWEEARATVEYWKTSNLEYSPLVTDALIWVYPDGTVGKVFDPNDSNIPPEGMITLEDYLKKESLKNTNPQSQVVQTLSQYDDILEEAQSDDSKADIVEKLYIMAKENNYTDIPSKEELMSKPVEELIKLRNEKLIEQAKGAEASITTLSWFYEYSPLSSIPNNNPRIENQINRFPIIKSCMTKVTSFSQAQVVLRSLLVEEYKARKTISSKIVEIVKYIYGSIDKVISLYPWSISTADSCPVKPNNPFGLAVVTTSGERLNLHYIHIDFNKASESELPEKYREFTKDKTFDFYRIRDASEDGLKKLESELTYIDYSTGTKVEDKFIVTFIIKAIQYSLDKFLELFKRNVEYFRNQDPKVLEENVFCREEYGEQWMKMNKKEDPFIYFREKEY